MGQLKKLAGQTAIYGISSILGRTINFLLIPIYTAYLTKDAVGSYTALYAYIAFFNVLFTYGMETTYFRFATGKGISPEKVFWQTQTLLIGSSLLLGGLIFFSAPAIASSLGYESRANIFRWIALILVIDAVMAIPYAKLRKENKALQFAGAKTVNILLNVGFNLFFIVFCFHVINGGGWDWLKPTINSFYRPDWEIEYIILSNLLANALILPFVFYLSGKIRFTWDPDLIKPMWKYTYPLLFMGLAGIINETFSRGLFEYLLPENFYPGLTNREATGVFGANFKLAVLMSLVIQSFRYAAEPFFFNNAVDKNSPQLFARVMHAFVIFCSTLMLLLTVNLNILGALFLRAEGYDIALYIVPVLLLGYLFLGIYFNLSIWFKLTDKTKYGFYFTVLGSIITIVVLIGLIPVFGFMGGALSTLLAYIAMSAACYWIGQRYFPIPYLTAKGLIFIAFAFSLGYFGFYLEMDAVWLQFILRNLLVLFFVLVVLWIEKDELSKVFKPQQKR